MEDSIISQLSSMCKFSFNMEDGYCTEISFYDANDIFEGTIRHHPEKPKILELVSKLRHLRRLNLRKCKVQKLPNFELAELESLDLSCNDLVVVPTWINNPSIKHLNLGSNQIKELTFVPKNIETLKIHKNKISELPDLPKTIRNLNLYMNRIRELPKMDLPELESLSFGVSEAKCLPLLPPKLKWLTLVANKIVDLPDNFCSLSFLECVGLAKNNLSSLPKDIGNMNIKEITLYQNDLNSLPESFYELELKKLNISRNPLGEKDRKRVKMTFDNIDFLEV